jgi:hypothetical protein
MRYAIAIFVLVILLSSTAFAQEDTLILLGSNDQMFHIIAVSAYNKYAFCADIDWGTRVIDYSDPCNPESVERYPDVAYDIEIKDSLAYYAKHGITIRNISNPLEPYDVGSCCYDRGFKIHVFDTLALYLHSTPIEYCYLKIISISDPTNPYLLSTVSPPNYPSVWTTMDAYKKDNYVYWVDAAFLEDTWEYVGRITVLDISDPTEPVAVSVDTCLPSVPRGICIKDNYAYIADWSGGLIIFDISDPYNIDSVGCFKTPQGSAFSVYIKGNYAYVTGGLEPMLEGLVIYVLDITDRANPSLVTYYDTPGTPNDVFVDEPYVLVSDHSAFLVFQAGFLSNLPGDANCDWEVTISDAVYSVNYLFKNGPEPSNINLADINADCWVDIVDVVYLINYLFRDGSSPQEGCVE